VKDGAVCLKRRELTWRTGTYHERGLMATIKGGTKGSGTWRAEGDRLFIRVRLLIDGVRR
jgi:hypothetical protein